MAVPPDLVPRPIHMCFDEEGALYVTESSGDSRKAPVQAKDPTHRILRLVDRDADGVFDHATVFAENVPFPEGILVNKGSVYVVLLDMSIRPGMESNSRGRMSVCSRLRIICFSGLLGDEFELIIREG